MGSLFYINVPTRKYEVELRQQEHRIKVLEEKDDVNRELVIGKVASGSLIAAVRRASLVKEKESKGKVSSSANEQAQKTTDPARRGSLVNKIPENVDTVDLYEATVDGKPANIIVSKDSMAIYPEDNKEEPSDTVSVQRKTPQVIIGNEDMDSAISNTFLEKHLEECLKKFIIYDATWGTSVDGNFSQISFTVAADRSESIISSMVSLGIGVKYESTLSVCSAIVYYNEESEKRKKKEQNPQGEITEKKETFGSKFVASIKSRLTVAQVVQSVQANAVITFDYVIFIIVAAIIAGLGLLENSSVNLVASMLISPLMGPIMAQCFGVVIRDKRLVKTGVISECVGLTLCFLVGFTFGVSVAWAPFKGPWSDLKKWPTDEMAGRSRLRGLAVGAFVAIPSGAGVALSILAGNAGSLVGVAISASLLPPAVNAGLLWGVAFVHTLHSNDANADCDLSVNSTLVNVGTDSHAHVINHEFIYCNGNPVKEFALMGICSFGLTLLNIVLILITGSLVLKIKEVAPHTTRKTMNRFWKEDLKAMRDYNRVHGHFNKQEIINELNEDQQVRESLKNDRVFTQVTQRNLFGTSSNILDASTLDADTGGGDTEDGGAGSGAGSGGATLWNGFGLFGRNKPPPETVEVQTESPHPSKRPHLRISTKK